MVRHEAVRDCFNVALPRGTQKFIQDREHDSAGREVGSALERVHREEDSRRTDVLGIGKAWRAAVAHARGRSKVRAARLKPRVPPPRAPLG